jgi:hypothetical protein
MKCREHAEHAVHYWVLNLPLSCEGLFILDQNFRLFMKTVLPVLAVHLKARPS